MIKAVIFDVDGVILESVDIKTNAFGELFKKYPKKQKVIIKYHEAHMGISRYVKFRYIYDRILGLPLSKKQELGLGKKFSELVLRKVLKAPFVPGADKFLKDNYKKYRFFAASGTPEKELKFVLKKRKLTKFFKRIYGSPKQKAQIVREIISRGSLKEKEIVFVGDASTDQDAAQKTGVHFILRKTKSNHLKARYQLKDLKSLSKVIEKI